MLFQKDEKGHVIIGEAALSLALSEKEISVSSLIDELGCMIKDDTAENRKNQIIAAREWLQSFESPEKARKQVPYLRMLAGLNERLN